MTQLKIVSYEEAKAERCNPWDFELGTFPEWMLREMERLCVEKNGLGLAAPQAGVFKRFFLLDMRSKGGALTWHFNPVMRVLSHKRGRIREGCLTIPGEFHVVERYASVALDFRNEHGEHKTWAACKELLAVAIQDEINHLDGICIKDWADLVKRPEEEAAREEAKLAEKAAGLGLDAL